MTLRRPESTERAKRRKAAMEALGPNKPTPPFAYVPTEWLAMLAQSVDCYEGLFKVGSPTWVALESISVELKAERERRWPSEDVGVEP